VDHFVARRLDGGHWVGELWLAYLVTGEERYGELARKWCETLRGGGPVHTKPAPEGGELPLQPIQVLRMVRRRVLAGAP
jgi:hypothetical protein